MLYLIGAGLWDEKDISLRALNILKECDEIFIESYTSIWKGDLRNLNLKTKEIGRSGMEEEAEKILKRAKKKKVAVLVPGDPLAATTHFSVLEEAKKRNVEFEIIHNASINTAIAETGLQLYKFGKTASISWDYSEYPYDLLKQNRSIDAHTLFLLDLGREPMPPKQGLNRLLEIEKERKENLVSEDSFCIVCCKLGSREKKIFFGKVRDLLGVEETPAIIILPGKLHFSEEAFVSLYKI